VTGEKAKVGLDAWREMGSLQRLAGQYMDNFAKEAKEAIAAKLTSSRYEIPQPANPPLDEFPATLKLTFPLYKTSREMFSILYTGADNNFVSEILLSFLGSRVICKD
jgi:hypothetical protein